ncbi:MULTISPECIES: CHAD domain-containing protein [unclassified Pseudomonas]|uniref:CHAD domain-containing protein n=1 Tax=unclassified Pseudomonas TaxID=196821 RepID=UPI002447072F|nr:MULTISPECIES: CHAD domain-containing protein [unclassified Pseudomonas]MDG9924164.1 CHAD domain-containing protein [Pseudomonas sp. GD04045]MDH0036594.1 CHAD domain-containing protein [Pseudomonas sp. GD04019]
MAKFQRELRERIIELQVKLYACIARLQVHTDDEALHDLRIALRRLRSLLRPLRSEKLCAALERAAAALGETSGPLRDLEVLAGELEQRGQSHAAQRRRAHLAQGYARLLEGLPLNRLLILLDDWHEDQRQLARNGEWHIRGKAVTKYMRKQSRKLAEALRNPAHDRHRLRLLIKRLRYCHEAWPQPVDLPAAAPKALRNAQSALGDWHDHWQWLQRLQTEPDLVPCAEVWRERLQQAEAEADLALQALLEHFPEAPAQS